jgi:hypothetical protein
MSMKIRLLAALSVCLTFSNALAVAQRGTAESGYWPMGYHGDTFTGVLTSADDSSRSITLTYTNPKNGKTETLTAAFREGYAAKWSDGTTHQIKPSDFRLGTRLKIYYMEKDQKVNGEKVKTYTIWRFKMEN